MISRGSTDGPRLGASLITQRSGVSESGVESLESRVKTCLLLDSRLTTPVLTLDSRLLTPDFHSFSRMACSTASEVMSKCEADQTAWPLRRTRACGVSCWMPVRDSTSRERSRLFCTTTIEPGALTSGLCLEARARTGQELLRWKSSPGPSCERASNSSSAAASSTWLKFVPIVSAPVRLRSVTRNLCGDDSPQVRQK